jgi:ABC-2 type transport system ATP-binding protein
MGLKASVPGSSVIEVHFKGDVPERESRLRQMPGVTGVERHGTGAYRVMTSNGSQSTTQLVELALQTNDPITSLSVQNTSLDDVFVYYTGRQLRDEQVKSVAFTMPPRPGMQP